MQRPKIKVDKKILVRQKKESIEELVKESQSVQLEIKALQIKKKGIEKYIDDALAEATKALQEQVNAITVDGNKVKEFKDTLNEKTVIVNKKIEEINLESVSLDKREKSLGVRIDKVKKEKKENDNDYEDKLFDVKERENVVSENEGQLKKDAEIFDQSLKNLVKSLEELEITTAENNKTVAKIEGLTEDLEAREKELTKNQASVLSLSKAVDRKEVDLIKRDDEQDKRDSVLDEKKKKIEQEREDALVNKKQLQVDILRNKEMTTELKNRETKLAQREKLFKTKIGGK